MRALVWFRRDLRLFDHSALHAAAQSSSNGIVGVYVISAKQWKQHDEAPAKVHFWLENLRCLQKALSAKQIPLVIVEAPRFEDCPQALIECAKQNQCSALYFNEEYEVNELRRDRAVTAAFRQEGMEVESFLDRVLLDPNEVSTQEGKPYTVFTPYRKSWEEIASNRSFVELPAPPKQPPIKVESTAVPEKIEGYDFSSARPDLWEAGEEAAQNRLGRFVENRIKDYADKRDLPAVNGTSVLSPYLSAGVISIRSCINRGLQANQGSFRKHKTGPGVWLSELIWREFYNQVMVAFPRVSKHRPFREDTEAIPWRKSEADFEAWKEGRTGYPLVDAAMRQLNQTGWMHNRLRMVTAMFLTKHLLLDWRWGEQYFMQRLIDGDLAANNGGWQWSASTGTDAVPYFRIFNPFSQSQRFDKDGEFIRKFCPELANVKPASLHDPKKFDADARKKVGYPEMIVEHASARQRALDTFKAAKSSDT